MCRLNEICKQIRTDKKRESKILFKLSFSFKIIKVVLANFANKSIEKSKICLNNHKSVRNWCGLTANRGWIQLSKMVH